jgi:hypothetical protein
MSRPFAVVHDDPDAARRIVDETRRPVDGTRRSSRAVRVVGRSGAA